MTQAPISRDIPVLDATRENTAAYGLFIGTDVPNAGLSIPFYKGSVEEGHNIPFVYRGDAVIRTARIHPRPAEIDWLERHRHMTQLFFGLGDASFAMVLGKPHADQDLPNLDDVVCFRFPPGHGIMLHLGTWHDFPLAVDRPVTCLTANSDEVVAALASVKEPAEMDFGDVQKLDIRQRLGVQLRAVLR
jgi:ureidoglycolate lyase